MQTAKKMYFFLCSRFDGKTTIRKQVPDTITSWVISGFSVDPLFGLGLSDTPRKVWDVTSLFFWHLQNVCWFLNVIMCILFPQLRVFRPFFVSLDLPYSVIRGEIVAIPIVVFNYMNKDLEADVTLENEQLENFEFAEVSNDVREQPSKWLSVRCFYAVFFKEFLMLCHSQLL